MIHKECISCGFHEAFVFSYVKLSEALQTHISTTPGKDKCISITLQYKRSLHVLMNI